MQIDDLQWSAGENSKGQFAEIAWSKESDNKLLWLEKLSIDFAIV